MVIKRRSPIISRKKIAELYLTSVSLSVRCTHLNRIAKTTDVINTATAQFKMVR
jgi:hypothetical protein